MKYKLLILCVFSIFSCIQINSKQEKSDLEINDTKNGCKLEFFDKIPEKYGLSGDYYTYDTTDLSKDKYIFISDLDESAIIIINGVEIQLVKDKLKSTARKDDYFEDVWKGNGVDVTLKLKILRDEDEEIYCKGILEISIKNNVFRFNIHGNSIT